MSLQRQGSRFLIVGSTTVAIDLAVYSALLCLGVVVPLAKGAGFITGTIFAYFANRLWTFGADGSAQTVIRFLGVYLLALGINVSINDGLLVLAGTRRWNLTLAFIIATGASAAFNFVGMRYFAFAGPRA
jgi:putative flippase GtrA